MNVFSRVEQATDVFKDADSALAMAVVRGDSKTIHQLASAGVDIDAQGDRGITMLQWAIYIKSAEGLRALLAAGANAELADDTGTTAVHDAAQVLDHRYLQILLEHGVAPDTHNPVTGSSPLVYAIRSRRHIQFKSLLAKGADPSHADQRGNTPLIAAAEINAMDYILTLLDIGADGSAQNANGHTFKTYLDITPAGVLLPEVAAQRLLIDQWLQEHSAAKS